MENGIELEKCALSIEGMTCASCVLTIENHVGKIKGVAKISIALLAGRAEAFFDPKLISPPKIAKAISDIGYNASVTTRSYGDKIGSLELKIAIVSMVVLVPCSIPLRNDSFWNNNV